MINDNLPSTQTELAESYGITKQTMNNYMRMATMIPELEDLVDIRKYDEEDKILKDLIEISQLEESPKNSETPITQEAIAKMNGMSVDTFNNYKKLIELVPELQDL